MNEDEMREVLSTFSPDLEFSLMTIDQQNVFLKAMTQCVVSAHEQLQLMQLVCKLLSLSTKQTDEQFKSLEARVQILEGLVKNNG